MAASLSDDSDQQWVGASRHWGRPEIVWYSGGHTGFFRSRPVQRFIDDAIVQSGLVDRPDSLRTDIAATGP